MWRILTIFCGSFTELHSEILRNLRKLRDNFRKIFNTLWKFPVDFEEINFRWFWQFLKKKKLSTKFWTKVNDREILEHSGRCLKKYFNFFVNIKKILETLTPEGSKKILGQMLCKVWKIWRKFERYFEEDKRKFWRNYKLFWAKEIYETQMPSRPLSSLKGVVD